MKNFNDSGNVLCVDTQLSANDNLQVVQSRIFFPTIVIRIGVLKSGGGGREDEKKKKKNRSSNSGKK